MGEEIIERRLAAVLAADIVGYTRLMEANEERTLVALKCLRNEFFDPVVATHGGRIFKAMGDGFLVEFASVVSAARCAVELQQGMPARNAGTPEDREIKFRMGINVGDLIVEGDDFFGDCINVASRLEALAAPGGIALSAEARIQVGNKLDLEFDDQGSFALKNLSRPLQVYFARLDGPKEPADAGPGGAGPPERLSFKPSVAVLPFANLSNDPEQEFFSDGITEDIITDLSKVSGLSVLSRNTVFTFKGKAQNLETVARQLGVSYLVEGSVRKAGNRVRITAQLIEGATDRHIWADRYDRDLDDIFSLQDEITETVVAQLKVKILPEEKEAIGKVQTRNTDAYTAYLRGAELLRNLTKSSLLQARQLFARATEIDPQYARAFAGMANCATWLKSHHGADITVDEILVIADRALEIDPNLADAHAARGAAMWLADRREEADEAFEKALVLDPKSYQAHSYFARFLETIGDFERAAEHNMRAMEIQPEDYQAPLRLCECFFSLGRRELGVKYARIGIRRAQEAVRLHPENSRPVQLGAAALARIGEAREAREWVALAMEIDPDDNHMRYNAACTYAQLGDTEKALALLEIWLPNAASNMRLWFSKDVDLAPLHNDPRFEKLLRQAGR